MQRSGIDTIKYHTWPRIPMGKWQTHSRHHKREPSGQPFPSRWPQSTYKQTRTKHSKHKTEQKQVRKSIFTLRSHANNVHICILKGTHTCYGPVVLLEQKCTDCWLKNRGDSCDIICALVLRFGCLMKKIFQRKSMSGWLMLLKGQFYWRPMM